MTSSVSAMLHLCPLSFGQNATLWPDMTGSGAGDAGGRDPGATAISVVAGRAEAGGHLVSISPEVEREHGTVPPHCLPRGS